MESLCQLTRRGSDTLQVVIEDLPIDSTLPTEVVQSCLIGGDVSKVSQNWILSF